MEKYIVIQSKFLGDLSKLVIAKMEIGYIPTGGIAIDMEYYEASSPDKWYTQALYLSPIS